MFNKVASLILLIATMLLIVTESCVPVGRYTVKPDFRPSRATDEAEFLFLFEQTLTENGFEIRGREIENPFAYTYHLRYGQFSRWKIKISSNSREPIKIETIKVELSGRRGTEGREFANRLIEEHIVKPLSQKISKQE